MSIELLGIAAIVLVVIFAALLVWFLYPSERGSDLAPSHPPPPPSPPPSTLRYRSRPTPSVQASPRDSGPDLSTALAAGAVGYALGSSGEGRGAAPDAPDAPSTTVHGRDEAPEGAFGGGGASASWDSGSSSDSGSSASSDSGSSSSSSTD